MRTWLLLKYILLPVLRFSCSNHTQDHNRKETVKMGVPSGDEEAGGSSGHSATLSLAQILDLTSASNTCSCFAKYFFSIWGNPY